MAQARALERHWDVARAHTRQSNLGQGTAAAWLCRLGRARLPEAGLGTGRGSCEQGRRAAVQAQ